jgi:RNA polymerase sigma-70 factor (ECF subfamily)
VNQPKEPLEAEFLERLESHRKILSKIAYAYCRREADREDLISEMVVALWRSYGRYDERYAFATWTYRVALNVAISFYRKRARDVAFEKPWDDSLDRRPTAEGGEQLETLLAFVATLPPLDRALVLAYLDGYAHVEIAEMLGLSQTNVATKISRLKDRLRSAMQADVKGTER